MNKIMWIDISRYYNEDNTLVEFLRPQSNNTYAINSKARANRIQCMLEGIADKSNTKPYVFARDNFMKVSIAIE